MLDRLLWWFSARLRVRVIEIEHEPYLERYWLGSLLGWTAYLHHFVRDDEERWLHDHPWPFAIALVVSGGYIEERLQHLDPERGLVTARRALRAGAVNVIRARDFHRVTAVRPGTWTLFVHRRRCKSWGFLQWSKNGMEPRLVALDYQQPYDVERSADWERAAPVARELRRAA